MTRLSSKTLAVAVTLLTVAAPPALAQTAPAAAQCEQVMMQGVQHFAPSVVAGCTAYFQALADGATAPGTFSASSGVVLSVNASTSGG